MKRLRLPSTQSFQHNGVRGFCRAAVLMLAAAPSMAAVGSGINGGVNPDNTDKVQTGLAEFAIASGDLPGALHHIRGAGGNRATFLRARLLADTGDRETARRLLGEIDQQHPDAGEAALIMARMALDEGDDEKARALVNRAVSLSKGEIKQQAQFLDAEMRRKAGRLDSAGAVLANMEEGYWAALGYLNIASDYANHDVNGSRAIISLRVALAMTEGDTDAARIRELRSRILLRAGYISYQQEEYDKAAGFLEQVPLETFSTPRALYFHGLALSAQGNYRAAMQSWHRAKKYPLAYQGVAGAWLGMGRGYDMAGYLGQAGEAFLAANSAYDKERVVLRQLAEEVEQKGAWQAFVHSADSEGVEWFLAESRTLTQPRHAYLLHFMETPGGQKRVRQLAALDSMQVRLDARENDLRVFSEALRDRMTQSSGNRVGDGLPELDRKIGVLARRLGNLEQGNLSYAQSSRLADIRRHLDSLADRQQRLGQGVTSRNGYFAGLLEQTESALGKVSDLKTRLASLRDEAESRLNEEVRAFIRTEDERIAFNQDRAEQQIAHLYEFLATENLEGQAQ